jgi:hypothetical protein
MSLPKVCQDQANNYIFWMNCLSVMHFCLFLDRFYAEFFFSKKNWFSEIWIFFRLFTFGWYIIVQVFVLSFMTTYLVTF